MSLDRVLHLLHPCQPAFSPDGTRIAFTVEEAFSQPEAGTAARIWIAAADGSGAQRVTEGPRSDSRPAWSPDGRTLAFVSDRDKAKVGAVHVLAPDGSISRLGDVNGSVEDVRWSADGARVMALAADVGSDKAGSDSATTIGDGKDDPLVVRPAIHWRRLWEIDVATGATTAVPLAGLNVWEFDWHGGEIAALVSADPSENGWYDAHVVRIAGGEVSDAYTPERQLASIALSPDSGAIALVESLASDRGVLYGDVVVIDPAGETRTLAPGFDAGEVSWHDRDTLLCAGASHLGCAVATLALDGAATPLWSGDAGLGGHAFPMAVLSPDGATLVAGHSAWNAPPELRAWSPAAPGNGWAALSELNPDAGTIELPACERVTWPAPDGVEIEGFLITPPRESGAPPPPLLVLVHGGPTAAYGAHYPRHFELWPSAAGYALLQPNPRGSVGRGREFMEANVGDMGGGDLGDILAGIDALAEQGLVDGERVAVAGGSYGGFMAAWAITQTHRFKASIAMAAVTDWLSFHNSSNITRFDEIFMQADPYEPGGEYHRRSPVVHARDVRTPTLVMHGELDLCVPLTQGQELYNALAAEGVPTELIVYPREGHGWEEKAHQIDAVQRMTAWLDRYV